jgi:UDP-glucose 4-epimerase
MTKNILVTGGAGYVGSHILVSLLEQGYGAVSVDNLSNASAEGYNRLRELTGKDLAAAEADVKDAGAMAALMDEHDIWAVIHCAAHKSPPESVGDPLKYYKNNLASTVALCEAMRETGVTRMVFSSSATVYGTPEFLPITEGHPVGNCANPYGTSKAMSEQILTDAVRAYPDWGVVLLRYFNPIGAHPSGQIGDSPNTPVNIMPYLLQVMTGRLPFLPITGNDYETPDGTGVRDYLHVTDLADGHVAALRYLENFSGVEAVNLGTGRGSSVMEIVREMEKAIGEPIPTEIRPRRPGDVAAMWADVSKSKRLLGWEAKKTLAQMCEDSWHWASKNPDGYGK